MKWRGRLTFARCLRKGTYRRSGFERAAAAPDEIEEPEVGLRHYIKRIPEYGDRWLRVAVNTKVDPPRGITAFFDRRLKRMP